jgi:hypothetical protein
MFKYHANSFVMSSGIRESAHLPGGKPPVSSTQSVLLAATHPSWGNQAAQRFAQTCPLSLPGPGRCPFGGICHACPPRVQAELRISQPGDQYEQEADRVADQILRMPEPAVPEDEESYLEVPEMFAVQRQCLDPECEEEEIQLKKKEGGRNEEMVGREVSPTTGGLSSQLAGLQGGGRPLSPALRSFFEPRFGQDFSRVRVHTGEQATRMAEAVKARAFTLGRNMVFHQQEFAPETPAGKRLLAHELTHVVQQQGAPAQGHRRFSKITVTPGTSPAGPLMRTIHYGSDCGPRQDEVERNIPGAQSAASRWARAGASCLSDPESVANLLSIHFNITPTDYLAVTTIEDHLLEIADMLDEDAFTYYCRPRTDEDCLRPRGPYAGYAYPGQPEIYFCDPYPYQSRFRQKPLIDTLLHEAAHAHDAEFNHDTYERDDDYPGDQPLTNADSYASFARDVTLGRGGRTVSLPEVSLGAVMSTDPQFYIAVGLAPEVGGATMDIFNMRIGVRVAYMPEAGPQPHRFFSAADVGLRVHGIRQRLYVDLATGAFFGANITDRELMSGIASRVSAGYRGEAVDLGLELTHLWDLVGDENMVIIGIRGAFRPQLERPRSRD